MGPERGNVRHNGRRWGILASPVHCMTNEPARARAAESKAPKPPEPAEGSPLMRPCTVGLWGALCSGPRTSPEVSGRPARCRKEACLGARHEMPAAAAEAISPWRPRLADMHGQPLQVTGGVPKRMGQCTSSEASGLPAREHREACLGARHDMPVAAAEANSPWRPKAHGHAGAAVAGHWRWPKRMGQWQH